MDFRNAAIARCGTEDDRAAADIHHGLQAVYCLPPPFNEAVIAQENAQTSRCFRTRDYLGKKGPNRHKKLEGAARGHRGGRPRARRREKVGRSFHSHQMRLAKFLGKFLEINPYMYAKKEKCVHF